MNNSPLKQIYNLERILFPETNTSDKIIDDFEEILIQIYSTIKRNERTHDKE